VRPDLVASVTSVGGVNKGSRVADVLIGAVPDVTYSVANAVSGLISFLSGSPTLPQNARAAATSLSTAGTLAFNSRHPQGVPTRLRRGRLSGARRVLSWSGAQPYTNVLDASDPVLALTSLAFNGAKNDGLVSSCSSHLGRVIRDDYALNHLDEVNQLIGITNLFETNPVTISASRPTACRDWDCDAGRAARRGAGRRGGRRRGCCGRAATRCIRAAASAQRAAPEPLPFARSMAGTHADGACAPTPTTSWKSTPNWPTCSTTTWPAWASGRWTPSAPRSSANWNAACGQRRPPKLAACWTPTWPTSARWSMWNMACRHPPIRPRARASG
jgi:hypothetical protein